MELLVKIADIPILIRFCDEETAAFFDGWECADDVKPKYEISADRGLIERIKCGNPDITKESTAEFNALAFAVSDRLLERTSAIFHGCAFIWRGKAWIFTAPSGTGKTTQYIQWKRQFGEEISILNGDKPILVWNENEGVVTVESSPWSGKERMSRRLSAELGGIIVLRQAKDNRLLRLNKGDAVLPLYRQFFCTPDSQEKISQVCMLEEKVLSKTPVWLFCNDGSLESAKYTHDELSAFLDGDLSRADV